MNITIEQIKKELVHRMVEPIVDRAHGFLDDVAKIYSSYDIIKVCLEEGANDVGFVEIDRKELGHVREEILRLYPKTKNDNFYLQADES